MHNKYKIFVEDFFNNFTDALLPLILPGTLIACFVKLHFHFKGLPFPSELRFFFIYYLVGTGIFSAYLSIVKMKKEKKVAEESTSGADRLNRSLNSLLSLVKEKQGEDISSKISKEFIDNPKAFCKKYFNKSGSSFVNFVNERCYIREDFSANFLLYAMSIPRAKDLSIDSFRKILLSYSRIQLHKPLELESAFQDYSLSQIETIFTNPHGRDYIKIFNNSKPQPVCRNFIDLREKSKELNIPKKILALDNMVVENFIFAIPKNWKDHAKAGIEFDNCAKDYWHANCRNLILVYNKEDNSPIACIGVDDGKFIHDIKGPSNKQCPYMKNILLILENQGFETLF